MSLEKEDSGLPPRRSKNGCAPCKLNKLKCDERQPKCGRCSRFSLDCYKEQPKPSLKQRRRGNGPVKARQSWRPASILPVPQKPAAVDLLCSGNSDGLSSCVSLIDQIDSLDWNDFDSLFAPTDLFMNYQNDVLDSRVDKACNSQQDPSIFDYDWISQPVACTSYSLDDSAPLYKQVELETPLTPFEHRGVHFFQTRYTLSRQTRPFRWSCHELFLGIAAKRPIVMHFILAVSLKQLAVQEQASQDRCALSKKHYSKGYQVLKHLFTSEIQQEHLTTIVSSWLLYHAVLDGVVQLGTQQRQNLSTEIGTYISKHALVQLCVDAFAKNAQDAIEPNRELSLLAKALIWLLYGDIRWAFTNTGGQIADLMIADEEYLLRLFDVSQLVLELNWGSDYPFAERITAIQCHGLDRLNYEVQNLHQRLNRFFWLGLGTWHDLECAISALETRFSAIFDLAEQAVDQYTRMLRRVDILTCEFYGLKIHLLRCDDTNTDRLASSDAFTLAHKFLKIAHRIWNRGYGPTYFDRPLFLVGTETDDLIHRDWIIDRVHETQLKFALTRVWQEQDMQQMRLSMSELRQIITDSYVTD